MSDGFQYTITGRGMPLMEVCLWCSQQVKLSETKHSHQGWFCLRVNTQLNIVKNFLSKLKGQNEELVVFHLRRRWNWFFYAWLYVEWNKMEQKTVTKASRDAWIVDSELLIFLTLTAANPEDKSVRAGNRHAESKVRLQNNDRKKNGKQPLCYHI